MARTQQPKTEKSAALLAAEQQGQQALYGWLKAKAGRASLLALETGWQPATVTRLGTGQTPISLEAAILIELMTDKELKAEQLCPSKAHLIQAFRMKQTHRPAKVQ